MFQMRDVHIAEDIHSWSSPEDFLRSPVPQLRVPHWGPSAKVLLMGKGRVLGSMEQRVIFITNPNNALFIENPSKLFEITMCLVWSPPPKNKAGNSMIPGVSKHISMFVYWKISLWKCRFHETTSLSAFNPYRCTKYNLKICNTWMGHTHTQAYVVFANAWHIWIYKNQKQIHLHKHIHLDLHLQYPVHTYNPGIHIMHIHLVPNCPKFVCMCFPSSYGVDSGTTSGWNSLFRNLKPRKTAWWKKSKHDLIVQFNEMFIYFTQIHMRNNGKTSRYSTSV